MSCDLRFVENRNDKHHYLIVCISLPCDSLKGGVESVKPEAAVFLSKY